MTIVFADTSFFVAAVNPVDAAHARAVAAARFVRGPVVTTDFVLIEVANFLSRGTDRQVFQNLASQFRRGRNNTVVPADGALVRRGMDLFAQRPDKEWSLTDCISFVVMGDHGIREALTTDHHFEQAGFAVLLK